MDSICHGPDCCARVIQPAKGRRRLYCSDSCKHLARRARYGIQSCEICEREFLPSHGGQRTCGSACAGRLCTREHPVTPHPCTVCGEPHTRRSLPVGGGGKVCLTCSDECEKIARKRIKREPATCPVCGAEFMARRAPPQKYCSTRCMWNDAAGSTGHQRGCQRYGGEYRRLSRRRVFDRDGYHCHVCGRKTDPRADYPSHNRSTVDCIVPLSRGGSYTYENVATACARCNTVKKDHTVDEARLILARRAHDS